MGETTPHARLYFDYNATAPVRPEIREAVEPILFGGIEEGSFGNPSSIHWAGQRARRHLELARAKVARAFDRRPSEVIFTSGGSESDNLALFGAVLRSIARAGEYRANDRIVISAVEHPAVLEAAARLEESGVEVVRIPVNDGGRLDLEALSDALESPTSLVSVMAVNNETGIISPLEEIIPRAHASRAIVHVDAVQAVGRIPLPFDADLISISGHKLGGLKGTGALITRERIPLRSSVVGGPQERGHRAGTESVAGAVALAAALECALASEGEESNRLASLRARIDACAEKIPGAKVLGRAAPRVSGTTTVVFRDVDGDSVLQALDLEGIAASSGSACSSGSLEPSHVLLAMGVAPGEALSAVRFSMGWGTRSEDVERLVEVLPEVVARVRAGAPMSSEKYRARAPSSGTPSATS